MINAIQYCLLCQPCPKTYFQKRFKSIFVKNSDLVSHNVLGIRRSSPPYKALRSKAVGWNVGETKHHKGRKPDWCFSNPEPPNRRRSVYRLLGDVGTVQSIPISIRFPFGFLDSDFLHFSPIMKKFVLKPSDEFLQKNCFHFFLELKAPNYRKTEFY